MNTIINLFLLLLTYSILNGQSNDYVNLNKSEIEVILNNCIDTIKTNILSYTQVDSFYISPHFKTPNESMFDIEFTSSMFHPLIDYPISSLDFGNKIKTGSIPIIKTDAVKITFSLPIIDQQTKVLYILVQISNLSEFQNVELFIFDLNVKDWSKYIIKKKIVHLHVNLVDFDDHDSIYQSMDSVKIDALMHKLKNLKIDTLNQHKIYNGIKKSGNTK